MTSLPEDGNKWLFSSARSEESFSFAIVEKLFLSVREAQPECVVFLATDSDCCLTRERINPVLKYTKTICAMPAHKINDRLLVIGGCNLKLVYIYLIDSATLICTNDSGNSPNVFQGQVKRESGPLRKRCRKAMSHFVCSSVYRNTFYMN